MSIKTAIRLEEDTRAAARELALYYGCSISEAIRRAVLRERENILGIPDVPRKQQLQALHRLFALFEGHDARAEVRRLKEQDEYSL